MLSPLNPHRGFYRLLSGFKQHFFGIYNQSQVQRLKASGVELHCIRLTRHLALHSESAKFLAPRGLLRLSIGQITDYQIPPCS